MLRHNFLFIYVGTINERTCCYNLNVYIFVLFALHVMETTLKLWLPTYTNNTKPNAF